jgi:hypothetical protein
MGVKVGLVCVKPLGQKVLSHFVIFSLALYYIIYYTKRRKKSRAFAQYC